MSLECFVRPRSIAAACAAALTLTLAVPAGASALAPAPGSGYDSESSESSASANSGAEGVAELEVLPEVDLTDGDVVFESDQYTEADVVGYAEPDPALDVDLEPIDLLDLLEPEAVVSEDTNGEASGSLQAPDGSGIEPTVQHEITSLPAPQPGAEVFLRPSNAIFTVTGGGFGHGIGMSQYGAHGAGTQGRSHTQILAYYYPDTRLENRTNATVRVGITIDNDGITQVIRRSGLQVSNGTGGTTYNLPTGYSQFRVAASGANANTCRLQGLSGGSWSNVSVNGLTQACPITFSSSSEGTVDLVLPSGQQRVYRGSITATHRGTTSLLSVNTLSVQDYLRSVTLAEMPSSFHQQALRAQSVAARTYALSGATATAHYDVCDTTACQAYRGRGLRNADGTITAYEHANTDAAVAATNQQVLTYLFPDGQRRLITAMYSSSTGGHTTDAPGVATHGYLRGQPDPYDATPINPRHDWSGQLPATGLQSWYGINRIERIQILTRDGHGDWGGRVLSVRVEGFTAGGAYTYVNTTGNGLAASRPWPSIATGLSSNYFTLGGGSTTPPPAATPQRVAGENRYGTAAEVSRSWTGPVSVVYVVSGQQYPDALVAAARSGTFDAPVLLTQHNNIPSDTRAALTRLRPQRIVVVGSSSVVSNTVFNQLRSYATTDNNLTMQRVHGADRYGTAAAMAAYYPANQQRVYLASGQDFPDALAAAALAAYQGAPLLLTRSDRLDDATIAQLQRLNAGQLVVVGGPAAVSNAVANQAASYGRNATPRRVGGTDRYQTMRLVAAEFPVGHRTAYVASGQDFPDALVGAALAGNRGGPVILTQRDRVPSQTAVALNRIAPTSMIVIGGTPAITAANLNRLGQYLR